MSAGAALATADLTLGILAGGRGMRLGGVDKAWLQRDGTAQVQRIADRLRPLVTHTVVSANRNPERYTRAGIRSVADQHAGIGPLAGLHALGLACTTSWLLTVPVDVHDAQDAVQALLAMPMNGSGACVADADGIQPLLALWSLDALRRGITEAIAGGDFSVQALQRTLNMETVRVPTIRIGNLNTPADLAAAGIVTP